MTLLDFEDKMFIQLFFFFFFFLTNIQHYSFVVMRLYTVEENCHLWQW